MANSLVRKYNVPGPRYTSYPTVPYWDESYFNSELWEASIKRSFEESNTTEGLSLYIHLPYCESLCTFCGCTKRITKRHDVELPYINTVLKEWNLYCDLFDATPKIKEIHLGGGTPTFFSPTNLSLLMKGLLNRAELLEDYEFSFEGHPNNTTISHLQTLYDLGFRRVSFGVQDYNPKVQFAIHRTQSYENVKNVTQMAREIGYTSVGHDIVFGLPFQTEDDIKITMAYTNAIKPDRIAFYSYAHVPWIKGNGQRGFKDQDLPSPLVKRAQYESGKQILEREGYVEIGMDHFALKSDKLHIASQNKQLHRNFMGYTASKTLAMVGLGVSSISDSWYGFAQNTKDISEYIDLVDRGIIPVYRGHILSKEDLIIRRHILNLMCNFRTSWSHKDGRFLELPDTLIALKEMEQDGLVQISSDQLKITSKGKPFVRNVCMAFDLRLQRHKAESKLFSMTI